jgi:hypothetical protein
VRRRSTCRAAAGASAFVLLGSLAGCGGSSDASGDHHQSEDHDSDVGGNAAADVSTCHDQATAAPTPYGRDFPATFPFPPGTTVFHVEHRGKYGTIATGISTTGLKGVLGFMNGQVVGAGFKTTEGETEEHDAEANWQGNGYRGRWAIRDSANCPGETVIQVLAAKR